MTIHTHIRTAALAWLLILVAGCSKDSNPVGPGADPNAPVVSILAPTAGAVVRTDSLTFEAEATDSVGVVKVEFVVDGSSTPIATVTSAPWKAKARVTTLGAGQHAVVAHAYDAAGNKGSSAPVTFSWRSGEVPAIAFRSGARFVYDRWDLDDNSQRDESTRGTYITLVSAGDGTAIGGQTDWFRLVSTDSRFPRKDTLIARTNAAGDVQSYGFVSRMLRRFLNGASGMIDPSTVALPAPTWDAIGKFNADASTALPLGSTWDVTPSSGVNITVTISGVPLPITFNIKIKGMLEDRGETFVIGGRTITTWKVRMDVTISVLTSKSTLTIRAWFSDDPSGQIRMRQETGVLNLITQNVTVYGDEQMLVSYTE